jgi:hypothetical protein
VDIEGSEAQLFGSTSDATLGRIGQIGVEFHDFIPNTISSDNVRQIRRRLERLGFVCLPFSYLCPHQDTCDLLFVNLRVGQVPLRDRFGFAVIKALLTAQRLKSRLPWRPARAAGAARS